MLPRRRVLLAAPFAAIPAAAAAAPRSFGTFLDGLRAEAARAGIRPAVISAAFEGVSLNPKVLQLDKHQPEFTMTWAQYRSRIIPPSRMAAAAQALRENGPLLQRVSARYGVDPHVIVGIWGLESGFGVHTGNYREVEALATLAYDGRRAGYFRSELMNALRILDHADVGAREMTGSWAGAMGQPQFMPSSYLRYAVDFDGDGRRDIWRSLPDVFGSVANYLGSCGWRSGEPWGQPVAVPRGAALPSGRESARPLSAWQAMGVRRANGAPFSRTDVRGALVQPDGPGGDAFMVYANFHVIRRYNPSDYYALAVGLLGYGAS